MILANLQEVKKRGAGAEKNFTVLPYPIFKYKTAARRVVPILGAFSTAEIFRPACFLEVFPTIAQSRQFDRNSHKFEHFLHVRFYGFDLRACDPSMWNSEAGSKTKTPFFTADRGQEAEEGALDANAFQRVDKNIINFLLDADALQNATLET